MDYPVQYSEAKKENYWCEQLGKYVKQCQEKSQCFECALLESQKFSDKK